MPICPLSIQIAAIGMEGSGPSDGALRESRDFARFRGRKIMMKLIRLTK